MNKYKYVIKNKTVQVIGYEDSITVYNIESWKPERVNYYRSLLAHRRDMDYAKEYLNQMFFDENTTLIDGSLMNSAIQLLVRCFSNPRGEGRNNLNSVKVFRIFAKEIGEEDLTEIFKQFYDARNQVIVHDQLNYKDNIIGLAVNNNSGMADEVATVTIRTGYLYKKNQLFLLRLVDVVTKYIDVKLEEQSKYLISEYNSEEIKPVLDVIRCEDIPMATTW